MDVNINEIVEMELTADGKDILNIFYMPVKAVISQSHDIEFVKKNTAELEKITNNSKFTGTLWEVMHIFGKHLYNGGKQLFIDNIITFRDF